MERRYELLPLKELELSALGMAKVRTEDALAIVSRTATRALARADFWSVEHDKEFARAQDLSTKLFERSLDANRSYFIYYAISFLAGAAVTIAIAYAVRPRGKRQP